MRVLLVLFVFVASTASGQQLEQVRAAVKKIQTEKQAKAYLAGKGAPAGQVLEINAASDTTESDRELIALPLGEIIEFPAEHQQTHYFYKSIEHKSITSFRVQYIFLDHTKISLRQVDSLRTVILNRIQAGEDFDVLARTFSMDGNNKKGGDLGWFQEGMMDKSFEERVRKHQPGEVYTVDIPESKWYYIVKNTHPPRIDKKVILLYLEVML
ncbi:peptidylprolyl isomerase [Fulvivirgaceae bacterium PWU5]|uniref:peptidylprolyl isomerase n=1 Tax=Dawidia cretensis TaxID=2782350 RepID=A0AAP2GUD1_9BACT|nr:peptidylprolyl isomerase [Dawidia cretensis]MBT1707352.1 peptidylprolyl isomerase [Dawidia cretensis]